MRESNSSSIARLPAFEFFAGKHSLFCAAVGQSFFYLHLFKPQLPVWVAGPLFMTPWAIVFILLFHQRPIIDPRTLRGCWLLAAVVCALFTVMAELIWLGGAMPSWATANPVISIALIQTLMNMVWLSFIPIVHDYIRNPHLWP